MAMKKYLIFAVTATALILSSCAKETRGDSENSVETIEVKFDTAPIQTRTYFGDKSGKKYPVLWSDTDAIAVSLNYGAQVKCTVEERSVDNSTATFSGTFSGSSPYTFYAVYPYAAWKSSNKGNQTILMEIPGVQTPTATGPDGDAQILYAKATDAGSEMPASLGLSFSHVTGYFHMCFENYASQISAAGANILGVSVTYDDAYIAGRLQYHVDTDALGESGSSMLNTISINTTGLADLNDVWCALAPVNLSSKSVTVVISTDKGSMTKVVTMPAAADLTAGKIAKFTVDMSGVGIVAPVVYTEVTDASDLAWGDRIIIAAADADVAIGTNQNTNNRSAVGIARSGDTILDPADEVEIFTLEDGVIPGHFALKTKAGEYIYAAGNVGGSGNGGNNYLRSQAGIDTRASWEVSISAGVTSILSDANTTTETNHIDIRFNAGYTLFSAYLEEATLGHVKVYKQDGDDSSPRFKASMPADGTIIDGGSVSIPVYVFGNSAWTASVSPAATLSPASGTGNAILTLTVPANASGSPIDYTVTVSTSAAVVPASYDMTFSQAIPLVVNDIIWSENWKGSANTTAPSAYFGSTGGAGTYCYAGNTVLTYTQSSGTQIYNSSNNTSVYYTQAEYTAHYNSASDKNYENLLIAKGNGYWTVSGIPVPKNVAKAKLYYRVNSTGTKYTVECESTGVTVDNHVASAALYYTFADATVSTKKYYENTYDITFGATAGNTFDLKFINTNADANVRVADIELIVTDLK